MKTTDKNRKNNPVINQLREVRDKFNNDIENMSYEQLQAYLKKKESLHPQMHKNKND